LSPIPIAIPAACCLAMVAFSVAVLSGVGSQNDLASILERALVVILVAWPVGFFIGRLLERLFAETSTEKTTADEPEAVVNKEDAAIPAAAIPIENTPSSDEGEGGVSAMTGHT